MAKYLSKEEFANIYSKVPRLCVDLVIKNEDGVILIKRDITPWKSYWHLPGGSILYGETIEKAAKRVAKRELGIGIEIIKHLAFIEFKPIKGYSHPISIALLAKPLQTKIKGSSEGKNVRIFKQIPKKTILNHKKFLETLGFD